MVAERLFLVVVVVASRTRASLAEDFLSLSDAADGKCGNACESLLQYKTTSSQTHNMRDENGSLVSLELEMEMTLAEEAANMERVLFATPNDLTSLVSSCIVNGSVVFYHILFFCLVRFHHPTLFANGWLTGRAPKSPGDSLFGWASASWQLCAEDVAKASGLDAAMLLIYQELVMKILMLIGFPLICVMCPLHYYYGGAMQIDPLSKVDMCNIVDGSWLFWLHAVITWMVVILVQRMLSNAQMSFMRLRYKWLRELPAPRAMTCLVQNIPSEFRSDEKFKSYVNEMFTTDAVESAYIVRKLPESLTTAFNAVETQREQLRNAEVCWDSDGRHPDKRPRHFASDEIEVDSINHFRCEVDRLKVELRKEQNVVETGVEAGDLAYYTCDGFVTFKRRHDSEVALGMQTRTNVNEIVFALPPDPMEVRYDAFQHDDRWKRRVLGHLLVLVLFFSYLPVVTALSYLTSLETLSGLFPAFRVLVAKYPIFTSVWDGVVGSSLLTLFISFVPSFLMLAIKGFFALPAETWCQHQLQQWYFLFQVVFVLLIFCIGNSLFSTSLKLVQNPTRIFSLLASQLPQTAHFYLNFFPLQWVSHCCQLARYWNLVMYYYYRTKVDSDIAYELCEPEDQDYYGMGARSARTSLLFVIALVFSSVSPLICLMALVSFFYSRIIFGYLLVYSETRKPDSGGLLWCTQLKHAQHGLFLYVTLMVGLLCDKAGAYGPGFLTSLCYIFMMRSYIRFDHDFRWVRLPFEDVVALESMNDTLGPLGGLHFDDLIDYGDASIRKEKSAAEGRYLQPELVRQS